MSRKICLAISESVPEYCNKAQMPADPKTTRSKIRSMSRYGRIIHRSEMREAAARLEVDSIFKTA